MQLLLTVVDAGAQAQLEELKRDVEQALHEAAHLAQRIYPPLLDGPGLGSALRGVAQDAGIRISLDVPSTVDYASEIARAVYWCCLDALEQAGTGAAASVTVREEDAAVAFEVAVDTVVSGSGLGRLRDRVEALGGHVQVEFGRDRATLIRGRLPLSV